MGNLIDLADFGLISETVTYNNLTKKYDMTDISQVVNDVITAGCDILIFPKGNFLIETPIKINRPIIIIGNNTNIYSSPSFGVSKTIFSVQNSNITIIGFNFFSKNEYLSTLLDKDKTALTSNICAINVLGEDYLQKNICIKNCYFECMCHALSVMKTKKVIIENVEIYECYFGVFTGYNAENIFIKDSKVSSQLETDKYGHALYFGDTTKYVFVENCILNSSGTNSCNVIKCGSNSGASKNVVVRNCIMNLNSDITFFYIHKDADLLLIDCRIIAQSKKGYARLISAGDNSSFKCVNCNFILDSLDRYTQGFNYTNSSVIFENCNLIIKNINNKYCKLPFESGSEVFIFNNCTLNINLDSAYNLLSTNIRNLEIKDCTINTNVNLKFGYDSIDLVPNFKQTTNPIIKIYNTVINNQSSVDMGTSTFFKHISKDVYNPIVELSNITFIKCSATSGSNRGLLYLPDVEVQYFKNNVVDLRP